MKCVVLDFNNKKVKIFSVNENEESIGEVLTKKYKFDLDEIEFIVVEDKNLEIKK